MSKKNKYKIRIDWGHYSWAKKILDLKIGIIPIIVYVPLAFLTLILLSNGNFPNDMFGAITIMMLFGFSFAEIGKRIPILKGIGGAAILATFLPSYMDFHDYIPNPAIEIVSTLWNNRANEVMFKIFDAKK